MKKSKVCRRAIKAFIESYPESTLPAELSDHIRSCAFCQREVALIEKTLKAAEMDAAGFKVDLARTDWEKFAEEVTDRVFLGARESSGVDRRTVSVRRPVFQPWLKPVTAGLIMGLVIGSLAMLLILKGRSPRAADGNYYASEVFIERLEAEAARRGVVDYLEKSRFILRDIYAAGEPAEGLDLAGDREAVRELLAMKHYLNPQLEKHRMAKAKAICDQIESLFRELVQVDESLSRLELERLRRVIEEKNLFLKINIVSQEIGSEV